MAGSEMGITRTSFRGTRKQVRNFVLSQLTQVGVRWVVRDSTGAQVYLQ